MLLKPLQRDACRLVSQILLLALFFQVSGTAELAALESAGRLAQSAEVEIGRSSDPATGREGLRTVGAPAEAVDPVEAVREAVEDLGGKTFGKLAVVAQAVQDQVPDWFRRLGDQQGDEVAPSRPAQPSLPARPPPPMPPGLAIPQPAGLSPGAATLAQPAAVDLTQVPLLVGPNLISLPNEPPDPDPAVVLAPIAGQFTAAFAYDNCDAVDPWKIYDPADLPGSDLVAIDHEIGLWIDATAATSLPSDGSQPAMTPIQLCTGWNLIGYPLMQERPVPAALASIAGKYLRVFGFELGDAVDPWEVYDVAAPDWANDLRLMRPGRGYWVLVTEDVILDYENEGAPPTVEILSPDPRDEIASIADVVGTVQSNLLDQWTLAYRESGTSLTGATWIEFASGDIPVTAGLLGRFDPTLLLNGMYDIRLQARDLQGQIVETIVPVAVDGERKVGAFTLSFSDLQVALSGLDIEVVRTYDSRDKRTRDFGVGWSLDIKQGSYENNIVPGDGWEIVNSQPPVPFPCVAGVETKAHLTTIRLSEREIYRFRLEVFNTGPQLGGCFGQARFAFVDGPVPGATLSILGNTDVFWGSGTDQLIDLIAVELYNPRDVRLRTRDGREFDFVLGQGVTQARDPNGNEITITPTSISHSSGVSITMTRDLADRITQITDPAGETLEYLYDPAGDLVAFTDRADNTTTFTYDAEHGLLDIFDPLGIRGVRNEYDEDGRLISTTDADGNTLSFSRDPDARREVISNRLGQVRVLEYDARGNVTREIDELGVETVRTFDGNDNLLSETDALGRTTTMTYNAGNDPLTITDPAGGTTTFTYDAAGRVLTANDPRGNLTTSTFDAAGNLTSMTDALGNASVYTYDASGNLLTETDPAGGLTTFTYDGRGNVSSRTDAAGGVATFTHDGAGNVTSETRTRTLPGGGTETLTTTFTYDRNGRRLGSTLADGSTTSQTYDGLGRVLSRTDPLGRTTSFVYDGLGRLLTTTFADGTSQGRTYDAEGRVLTRTDRAGRTTTSTYDAAGRLSTTSFPDGTSVTTTYDDAGQVASEVDQRGNTTQFEYDAAGRRTRIIDALGNATTYAYDDAGNQTAVTDANGNTTSFAYDDAGRRTLITFADGSTVQAAYDAAGRQISETDQAGRTTQFGYDALGRLTAVTDPLGQVTSFTYDEVGNRVSQTDTNGNTTSFTYDAVGRKTGRTLPDGASESFAYNLDGTLAAHTDFGGATTTFEYDSNLRQTRRIFPDGSQVVLTYSPTGRRTSVTDARGVTTYTYDALDRLTSETYPDGRRLDYAYDPAGNRTSLGATIGAVTLTTTYAYDALNRLSTVVDPDGETYSHTYDLVGNRASLTFPNGVQTVTSYDILNRLIDLTTSDGIGTVLQSYAFTLTPTGQRERIDEADGTSRVYAYDDLSRLVQDRVTDGGASLVYSQDFAYDPVGNRLSLDEDDGSGTVTTTTYGYDSRDRLLTESPGTAYAWDANGNLVTKTEAGGTTYSWDSRNRLIRVVRPDGSEIETVYDADGNRVRTEFTDSGGTTTATDYLVDTSGVLSHVVAESDDLGNVTVYYVRGDELLSLKRPSSGEKRFYHADGVGSIRLLTDATAAITDSYTYTAFGVETDHVGTDPQPYRFAAEPFDPNIGFSYNRARWLDPSVGRFASMDPFLGILSDPGTLHRYLYALNRPVDMVDPSGLFGSFSLATTLVVLTTLAILTNIAITAVVGTVAAVDDFQIDAGLATIGVAGQGRGLFGGSELDFLLYGGQFWVSPAFFIGFGPVAAFKTRSSRGEAYAAIGVVGNMGHPSEFEGAGGVALWPNAFLRLLKKAPFDTGRSWSLAMHLAKRAKNLRGTTSLVGLSSTGPIFYAISPASSSLGTAVTWNLQFQPLEEVFDRYGRVFEELAVGGVLENLRALGSSASQLGENGDELGALIRSLL